jgi:uncharacterized DUF497 family protein
MDFEWDAAKAQSNLAKHGIAFEDAAFVWLDPLLQLKFDRFVDGEERWWAIGQIRPGGLLVVVHLYPDPDDEGLVRIISARRATRHEKRQHEDGSI